MHATTDRVQSHAASFRSSATITARQDFGFHDANLEFWFRVTRGVAPGGVVDVVADVTNDALFISPFDPDACAGGVFNGYEYRLTVSPEWTSSERTVNCLDMQENRASHSFDFEAPTAPGNYDVEIEVRTPSGKTRTITRTVRVEEGGGGRPGAQCSTNEDCPEGYFCNSDGDCVPRKGGGLFGGLFGDINQVIVLLIVLFLAFFLATR